jgi:hypothetical protein
VLVDVLRSFWPRSSCAKKKDSEAGGSVRAVLQRESGGAEHRGDPGLQGACEAWWELPFSKAKVYRERLGASKVARAAGFR